MADTRWTAREIDDIFRKKKTAQMNLIVSSPHPELTNFVNGVDWKGSEGIEKITFISQRIALLISALLCQEKRKILAKILVVFFNQHPEFTQIRYHKSTKQIDDMVSKINKKLQRPDAVLVLKKGGHNIASQYESFMVANDPNYLSFNFSNEDESELDLTAIDIRNILNHRTNNKNKKIPLEVLVESPILTQYLEGEDIKNADLLEYERFILIRHRLVTLAQAQCTLEPKKIIKHVIVAFLRANPQFTFVIYDKNALLTHDFVASIHKKLKRLNGLEVLPSIFRFEPSSRPSARTEKIEHTIHKNQYDSASDIESAGAASDNEHHPKKRKIRRKAREESSENDTTSDAASDNEHPRKRQKFRRRARGESSDNESRNASASASSSPFAAHVDDDGATPVANAASEFNAATQAAYALPLTADDDNNPWAAATAYADTELPWDDNAAAYADPAHDALGMPEEAAPSPETMSLYAASGPALFASSARRSPTPPPQQETSYKVKALAEWMELTRP